MLYPQHHADLEIDPTRETRCDLNTLFGINGTWSLSESDKRQKLLKKIAVAEGSTIVIQRDFPSGKHVLLLKTLDGKELVVSVVSLTIINGIKENNIRAQFEQDERKK